jgi:cyclopropane-fatty-acyl-phospholipid synthase
VYNDTYNYELTSRHWAQNLDAHREEIERHFGTEQYRRFQIYLWGCVDGFRRDVVQAYRWVMELGKGEGRGFYRAAAAHSAAAESTPELAMSAGD